VKNPNAHFWKVKRITTGGAKPLRYPSDPMTPAEKIELLILRKREHQTALDAIKAGPTPGDHSSRIKSHHHHREIELINRAIESAQGQTLLFED